MNNKRHAALEQIAAKAQEAFTEKNAIRERALQYSRSIIRLSANAIRSVHRRETTKAKDLISEAANYIKQTNTILQTNPEIYYAGYLAEARKEFSEANITMALLLQQPLPQPEELGVNIIDYLKGMGDSVGEVRRYILDSLRRDEWQQCEDAMEIMDQIYTLLVTLDFPEGVTGGLRNTNDMVRKTLERTRGDFTVAFRQKRLEDILSSAEHATTIKRSY
ncbi:MAG: haloacid dehalogenase [Dehalococcoidia bacterium]|nr:haloacid dehalogenase [Dehalococcoidia bacterium]